MNAATSPVDAINGVWRFTRGPHHRARSQSTPGHLLHLLTGGDYRLTIDGRPYAAACGDIIAYYNTEEVVWLENEESVEFYSLAFQAPGLAPLPVEGRVFRAPPHFGLLFEEVYNSYGEPESPGSSLRCFRALYAILADIYGRAGVAVEARAEPGSVWWEVEQVIYERSLWRPSLAQLCAMAGTGPATLTRLCRAATGVSPHRRIAQLRMRRALGLLQYTPMSVSEAAMHLGYPRMNEFSREFSRHFGYPPGTAKRL
jgi:AraC-like DNA-binding protein